MADGTHIEWTDATWNPITGCKVVSPGCTNCYAMRLAGGRMQHETSRAGLTEPSKAGPVWNGLVRFNEQWLDQPLRWKKPRRIFVCAHGDLFYDAVPDEWIDRVFAVMALAPQHTFQVLTKRAKQMREYLTSKRVIVRIQQQMRFPLIPGDDAPSLEKLTRAMWPLPNVWLGVSVEDQARADERIPDLLATPAAKRFISAEPLLGPINLAPWFDWQRHFGRHWIDWTICGGESGHSARPMHPDWARSLRDQCQAAGVPFFFKQWGEWLPDKLLENARKRGVIMRPSGALPSDADMPAMMDGTFDFSGYQHFSAVGKRAAGRLLDGREWSEFPA